MKSKTFILFFLLLSALIPQAWAADFGEDKDYLGQVVDDYENADNVAAMIDVINNQTLDCMELNYSVQTIYENFSVYTEVDALNRLSQTDRRSTFTNINRADNDIYLYDDKGSNYFDDWSCQFELFIDSISVGTTANKYVFVVLGFGTTLGDYLDIRVTGVGFVISTHVAAGVSGYFLGIREFDTGSYWNYVDLVEEYDEDVLYYMVLEKSDTRISLVAYTDSDRTVMKVNQTINLQSDRTMRYIYCPQSMQTAGNFAATGYTQNLTFGAGGGYDSKGTYYLDNVLDGDPAIAILYNVTIPSGTGATMEFSTDNVTWVDHNNQAGSDTLIAGYEALDLRDIYSDIIYRRVNMTSNGDDTPRMWQDRLITVTDVDCGENVTVYENVTGAWVDYNFTSISTLIGNHTGGFLNSTYFKDGNNYTVRETVGAPGYDIRFNVTGLPDNLICLCLDLFMFYDGSAGHTFQIEVWNFVDSNWDFVEDIPDTCCRWFNNTLECVPNDYVNNGTLMGRFYHPSPGNVNHVWGIDYGKVRVFVPYENGNGGVFPSLFPGLAIGIALLIIGAIYALEKRR